MSRLTRREFLWRTMGTGAALGASSLLPGCAPQLVEVTPPPVAPTTDPARVAAVRGQNLAQMTRDALDAIGGIQSVVRPGETVFIE